MPVAIRSQSVAPNRAVTFDFDEEVSSYIVGLSYFNLSFGNTDHHIRTVSIALQVNKPSDRSIQVTANAVLEDNSRHGLDPAASTVGIVCIAASKGAPVVLANVRDIASGMASGPIVVDLPGRSSQCGLLSGFDLSYGNTDHHVERAAATAGSIFNGSTAHVTSFAEMNDDTGDHATTATINGAFLAGTSDAGLVPRFVVGAQSAGPITLEMDAKISSAVVLIQSWKVEFAAGRDHHVRSIAAGTTGWSVDASKVVLQDARATITDASGNQQDDAQSHVTLLVLATA